MTPDPTTAAFRFGYGLPVGAKAPVGVESMLTRLRGGDDMAARWPIAGLAVVQAATQAMAHAKRTADTDPVAKTAFDGAQAQLAEMGRAAFKATMARCIEAEDMFRERLVAFWADHFTVVLPGLEGTPMAYALVEDAIRPHLAAPFHTMLTAVVLHPAMLIYLDQSRSIGPNSRRAQEKGGGLNENLAREILELHSMGVGAGYGQDDVRQMAELLTGLTYDARRGLSFEGRRAEPGPEVVLGKSYDGKGDAPIRAALHDIARHADTARHIARKLAVHFLADTPDEAAVSAMAAAWGISGGDLAAVYAALLQQPAAWTASADKARQPWDFLMASLRALGVSGAQVMTWDKMQLSSIIEYPLRAMGQPWKAPPGPDGWPEEIEVWITPQGLAERITWGMGQPTALVAALPQPVDFARHALGNRASPALIWAAERTETVAEGVGIVLASPEFNRR